MCLVAYRLAIVDIATSHIKSEMKNKETRKVDQSRDPPHYARQVEQKQALKADVHALGRERRPEGKTLTSHKAYCQ